MKVHVALVREQGVEFAVVAVKPQLLQSSTHDKNEAVQAWTVQFGRPAVLMAQDSYADPTYYGRQDIVDFLSTILLEQLTWEEFTIAA